MGEGEKIRERYIEREIERERETGGGREKRERYVQRERGVEKYYKIVICGK
jgi:hypothetical protein